MPKTEIKTSPWREYLSPWKLTLLAINAVCFGACITLSAVGAGNPLLTIGTGLAFGAGLTGAIVAARQHGRP